MKIRVGMGFDVHQLVEGRDLWMGGIKIEHSKGLLGHSDADVLLHAVCDALLGAANMRDIGYHFPDFFTEEKKDDDGDKSLYVSYQKTPFCYADKNGKIYQFNFGKKMLKKWYKYDVQTYMEWAHAYERETKIDMKFKLVEKDTTVYEPDMSRSYRVLFHQESYQSL